MDIALIVFGALMLAAIGMWAYARLGDAREIDQEEETQVRQGTPQDRERSRFEKEAEEEEQNAEEIQFYSKD
jgi:Sec-independent protein translocase protein TatA